MTRVADSRSALLRERRAAEARMGPFACEEQPKRDKRDKMGWASGVPWTSKGLLPFAL